MDGQARLTPLNRTAGWAPLYRIAAASCLTVVGFTVVQIAVFFIWPPPASVAGWFELFASNRLVGLLDMDLLLTADYVLLSLVYLALVVALLRANPSLTAIAALFAFLGTAAYFASTATFEMLTLGDQFAVAGTEAEKAELLAAGRATVAHWTGTAFDVSYVLGAISILAFSFAMLRSAMFSRTTAYVGLVMGALMIVPPTAGTLGITLSLLSLVPTMVWLVLIARRFLGLARETA